MFVLGLVCLPFGQTAIANPLEDTNRLSQYEVEQLLNEFTAQYTPGV
jgi:hypothetical protein